MHSGVADLDVIKHDMSYLFDEYGFTILREIMYDTFGNWQLILVSVSVNGGLSGALVIELDERFSVSSAHRGHLGSGDLRHWRRVIQPLHTRLAKVAPLHRPLV